MTDILHNTILPFVEHFRSYAAWFAFFAAFGETLMGLGFFIPGSTLLLFMGLLAGQGYLDIKVILIFGIAGAYIGDIVNYHMGRRYGIALLKKPWLHLSDEIVDSAHRFLNSHGAKSVFFARFLPGMKESVSFLAGSFRMRFDKFLIWDFLGAVGWSFEYIGIGYLFSASLSLAQVWLSRTVTFVALLVFLLILLYLLKRFIVRNAPAAKSIVISLWKAFLGNEHVKEFIASHKKLTSFIRGRFDRTTFYGLPLTLFVLVFLYLLALFGGIVEDLLTKDPIIYVDRILANLTVQWRTPGLTAFFTWITYLGKEEVVLIFLAAAIAVLLLYRRFNELIALLFSLVGSVVFVYLSKLAFHRPRPEIALYYEPSYSFPSAHALISISFYGFICYLLMQSTGKFSIKINIFFVAVLLALLIGVSRIYLGEHYLSDVYGGYILGMLWALAAAALLEWLSFKKWFAPKKPFSHAGILSLIIVSVSMGLFVLFGINYRYEPLKHNEPPPKEVAEISELISNEEDLFTRNIIGITSLPVNMIVATDRKTDLCRTLKEAGWSDAKKRVSIDFPLFWHFKAPLCSLYKEHNGNLYLIKLWDSGKMYLHKKIYIATTDAITGFRWNFYPLFTYDLSMAREFAGDELKRIFPANRTRMLDLGTSLIKERLLEQPYFSDGRVQFIETCGDPRSQRRHERVR